MEVNHNNNNNNSNINPENDASTNLSSNNPHYIPRILPSSSSNHNPCKITLDMYFYIKIGIIAVIIIFLACNTVFTFALPHGAPDCLNDGVFNATAVLNTYFIDNTIARKVLLIVCSLCIDGTFFASSIYWIMISRSWRFLFVVLLFYGTRAVVQAVFQLGFPPVGFNWVSPDFPSLVTNYAATSDFFYSGHVGLPLIAALEFNKDGLNIAAVFCLLISCLEGFMLIVTRAHYSIDIFTGLVVAHYYFLLVDKYINIVDTSIIGMKRKEKEKESEREKEKEKDNEEEVSLVKAENGDNGYQKVNIVSSETE